MPPKMLELIVADWNQHGRLPDAQAAVPATPPAKLQSVSAVQSQEPVQPEAAPTTNSTGVADAAKRQQQLKACQALAKDNPSIVCK